MHEPREGDEEGEPAWQQVADGFDLEAACADHESMQLLQEAIDKLPPLQRTLVTLYHLEEMGIGEIAEVTGQPEGTVLFWVLVLTAVGAAATAVHRTVWIARRLKG